MLLERRVVGADMAVEEQLDMIPIVLAEFSMGRHFEASDGMPERQS